MYIYIRMTGELCVVCNCLCRTVTDDHIGAPQFLPHNFPNISHNNAQVFEPLEGKKYGVRAYKYIFAFCKCVYAGG